MPLRQINHQGFVQPLRVPGPNLKRSTTLHISRSMKVLACLRRTSDRLWLPNENSTYNLGFILGQHARPKDVLQLHGQLGAGKTLLAKGYVHSATGDTTLQVTSPTYLLTNTYPSSKAVNGVYPTIYHMDLWRLDDASSRPIVDFQDVFQNHISLIEWPDRLNHLEPRERLDVFLEYIPSKDGQASVDDPWGFGSVNVDEGMNCSPGRYARFVPHGQSWTERIEHFCDQYFTTQPNGSTVLKVPV